MKEVRRMDDIEVKLPIGIENFEEIRTEGFLLCGQDVIDYGLTVQLRGAKPVYAPKTFWIILEYEYA